MTLGFCAVLTIRRHLVRFGCAGPDIELLDDALIEALFVKLERHFIDRLRHRRRDYAVLLDVAEMRDLGAEAFFERTIAAAEQDIGLNSEAGQFLNTMLGRLGLELARRAE